MEIRLTDYKDVLDRSNLVERTSILSKMNVGRKSAVLDDNPFYNLMLSLVVEQAIDLDLDHD